MNPTHQTPDLLTEDLTLIGESIPDPNRIQLELDDIRAARDEAARIANSQPQFFFLE